MIAHAVFINVEVRQVAVSAESSGWSELICSAIPNATLLIGIYRAGRNIRHLTRPPAFAITGIGDDPMVIALVIFAGAIESVQLSALTAKLRRESEPEAKMSASLVDEWQAGWRFRISRRFSYKCFARSRLPLPGGKPAIAAARW